MKPRYYLLIVRGDVDPRLVGPFNHWITRDAYARNYRKNRDKQAEDGLFPLDLGIDSVLTVSAYSADLLRQIQR
jgi:hypothetical protein